MASEFKRKTNINRLYDYTKFHIGLYATLVTLTLTLITLNIPPDPTVTQDILLTSVAVLFALAGAFGGIVCTNCIRFTNDAEIDGNEPCVFWGRRSSRVTIQHIANAEHAFFWLGIVLAVSSLTGLVNPVLSFMGIEQ